jgi:hypothetical protein
MVRPTLRHRLRAAMLAVVALVIGVGLMTVGASPSSAGSIKGSLVISSVNDAGTGLAGGVAGRSMSVVVTRVDTTGAPLTVNQASGVALSAAKPGTLSGTTTGTIAAGASSTRISGAVSQTM